MLNRVAPRNLDGTRPPTYPHPPLYGARTHALVYMMFHTNNTIPLGILYPPLYIHSKKQMYLIVWEYARYIDCRRRSLAYFLSELFYISLSYTRMSADNPYSAVRKSADPLTVFVLTQGICRRLRCFCFSWGFGRCFSGHCRLLHCYRCQCDSILTLRWGYEAITVPTLPTLQINA